MPDAAAPVFGRVVYEPRQVPLDDAVMDVLVDAFALSGTDFNAACEMLRPVLARHPEPQEPVLRQITLFWQERDIVAISGLIYLLAHGYSPDIGAAAGWHALDLGCDNDIAIIALADVLYFQPRPSQSAVSLLRSRFTEHRSAAFHIKLADYYRDAGQAFLAEEMLSFLVSRGHRAIVPRLAEHWTEFRDWRSVRQLLRQVPANEMTPDTYYCLGRSCVSLLLEDELDETIAALLALPAPGPRYATLLHAIWAWRLGQQEAADPGPPDATILPSLVARDDAALRMAIGSRREGSASPPARWHNVQPTTGLPNVLGIGMQRTATSWLWHQLMQHPDVDTPMFKEPVFFSDPFGAMGEVGADPAILQLDPADLQYWEGPTRNLGRYRDLFHAGKPVRADFSPTYGELPDETVALMRQILGPGVRIILSVRDPVERSWSNLKYDLMSTGHGVLTYTLEQRMALYQSAATLRRCDYVTVLHAWSRHFDPIKIIFFDDVLTAPDVVVADVDRFLELGPRATSDRRVRVNVSGDTGMPREDRAFLFGLHQQNYREAEAELGGPARDWRRRQLRLLGG